MRKLSLMLGLAVALSGCGKAPELEPLEESGKFKSRADVEKFFEERANVSNAMAEPPQKIYEFDGSLVLDMIKKGSVLKFKGDGPGLWVRENMDGTVNAKGKADCVMRFGGRLSGRVELGSGVVWLEKLLDRQSTGRIEFEKASVLVLNSATQEQLKTLQGSLMGGPLEAVVFECDAEPGRYRTPWARSETEQARRGITILTVFARLPEASE